MRIVFMGTPEFAVPSLEALLRSDDRVVGVVTQPDRPKGRGQAVTPSPIKLVCQREGLPFLQPVKMKDPIFMDGLRTWEPELIAVAAFGRILPAPILSLPPKGCVNVHASLLPQYRGAGPIQWAIINGETETGITTMLMDEGMDTGDMLLQERIEILPEDTAESLSNRLASLGGRLLVETLKQLKAGTLRPTPQDHSRASLAPLLKKEDGAIDWGLDAVRIVNRVRGLSPWPGAYTFCRDERWTIWRAIAKEDGSSAEPGIILAVGKDAICVAAGRGTVALTEIQVAGGRRLSVAQYLAGHTLQPETRLSSTHASTQ